MSEKHFGFLMFKDDITLAGGNIHFIVIGCVCCQKHKVSRKVCKNILCVFSYSIQIVKCPQAEPLVIIIN